MVDIQRMILRAMFIHGDILLELLNNGTFYLIESERICTPAKEPPANMFDGVQFDPATGEIIRFAVFGRNKDGLIDKNKTPLYVKNQNAIFMARPFRPDQYRGLPEISSIITICRDLKEIRQAFLGKVKLDGKNAYAIYLEGGGMAANMGARGQSATVQGQQFTRIEDNQIYRLSEKERIQSLASNNPNAQFEGFYRLMVRIMGAAVGLPYEFVLQDFSQGNFSASRAALLQTYATFQIWQGLMTSRFLDRWYVWRLKKAIDAGLVRRPPLDSNGVSQIGKVYWNFPEWEWVDPQSQQQADLLSWQLGTKSHTDLVAKRGKDSEDVLREKFRNMAMAKQIADETNAQYGTAFGWQDGIYAAIPGQVNQAPVNQPDNKKQQVEE
jgi:lambda family phage portal protein